MRWPVLRINLTLVPSETILEGIALHRLLADFARKSFFFHLTCILATANFPTYCQIKVLRLLLCVHISMEIKSPIKCGEKLYFTQKKHHSSLPNVITTTSLPNFITPSLFCSFILSSPRNQSEDTLTIIYTLLLLLVHS